MELNELKQQLAEMQKAMAEFNEAVAPLTKAKEELDHEEELVTQEYRNKVAAIRLKKSEFSDKIFEFQKKKNQIKNDVWDIERKINAEEKRLKEIEKAKEIQAQMEVYRKKWDTLTAGAPWREWAKEHQIEGGKTIVENKKVILADPMGLGKTLTSIITLDIAQAATKNASPEFPFLGEAKEVFDHKTGEYVTQYVNAIERPVGLKILYFCPNPMVKNVIREFRRWAPHRAVISIGGMTKAERGFALDLMASQHPEYVVVCNYEAWRKDKALIESLINISFDTVIIDEAHIVKERKSIAYRGIKRLIDEMEPAYVIPMTGTPLLNRPQELFSLLTLVKPSVYYNERYFLQDHCEQNMAGKWQFKPGGLDRLSKKIRENFLRRTKDQAGIVLPPKTVTFHELEVDEELYPNQAKVRDQMRKNAMIMLDPKEGKAITAAAMIAVFTRLRQIETWPAGIQVKDQHTGEIILKVDVEESQKVDYIIRWNPEQEEYDGLIPEIITDERVVVFSQFKAPLKELKERCERAGLRAAILHGETSERERDEIMRDFDVKETPDRKDSKYDVLLANYRVGGVGMNLTAATQMIILDEEWNPGKRDQAYDRIHRIGQEKPVTIHVIRNLKTIDDWLAGLIEQKESLVAGLNDAMSASELMKEAWDALNDGFM